MDRILRRYFEALDCIGDVPRFQPRSVYVANPVLVQGFDHPAPLLLAAPQPAPAAARPLSPKSSRAA